MSHWLHYAASTHLFLFSKAGQVPHVVEPHLPSLPVLHEENRWKTRINSKKQVQSPFKAFIVLQDKAALNCQNKTKQNCNTSIDFHVEMLIFESESSNLMRSEI